jgi:hypothetical protein
MRRTCRHDRAHIIAGVVIAVIIIAVEIGLEQVRKADRQPPGTIGPKEAARRIREHRQVEREEAKRQEAEQHRDEQSP